MEEKKTQICNPYLPLYEYVPDGEPHVFGERVYIYGSHDRFDGEAFCLNDYVCYSADTADLKNWRFEGVIYRKEQDPRNRDERYKDDFFQICDIKGRYPGGLNPPGIHAMWAPDVVCGPDGRYYLYYCLDFLPEIGVAVCDTPGGRYEFLGFVKHPDGTPLGRKESDLIQFDPGIFIDDDGEIYLYSGNAPMFEWQKFKEKKGSQVMRLREDMVTLKGEVRKLLPTIEDTDLQGFDGHEFFEASSLRKVNGRYYFVYSSVVSHELCYAVSDHPDRGYTFGGTIIDICDQGIDADAPLNALGNTHGGIEYINGEWYVFYHRQTNCSQFSRQACAERIVMTEDGRIPQVPVTTVGLNAAPLEGNGIYPASVCCRLTGRKGMVMCDQKTMNWEYPFITQDHADVEPGDTPSGILLEDKESGTSRMLASVQYIANIADGTVIGYKTFRFDRTSELSVTVRGRALGKIMVFTDLKGACCMEIPVRIFNGDWMELSGTGNIPSGVHDIYLVYEGGGWLDLAEIRFM